MVIGTIAVDALKMISYVCYLLIIVKQKSYRIGFICFILISMLPGITLRSPHSHILFYRILVGTIFAIKWHKKEFLHCHVMAVSAYAFAETAHLIAVIAAYPFIRLFQIQLYTWPADFVLILLLTVSSVLVGFFLTYKISSFLRNIQKRIQIGIILICSVIELVSQELRKINYNSDYTIFYKMIFFMVIVIIIILIFWILDKHKENKKVRELTAYSHRTREIIPSLRRALGSSDLEPNQLLEELRSICEVDLHISSQEMRSIKSFKSTGIIVLDEQLKRYLEEAWEQSIELDIMVMAPVNQIIVGKVLERLHLIQIVGDMYRNACQAISKKKIGRILIRFGYNFDYIYEISFYDNGKLFTEYVLNHLGKRGVTTSGTGHGIADTLLVLCKANASFVIEQNLSDHNIFTKGIHIIFDGQGRIEILKSKNF
ncbi:MAG: hypothetical protein ACRC3H_11235 [Lachnospiraceae bacterium]